MGAIPFTNEGGSTGAVEFDHVFVRLTDGSLWVHQSDKFSDSTLNRMSSAQETGLTAGTSDLAAAVLAVQAVSGMTQP